MLESQHLPPVTDEALVVSGDEHSCAPRGDLLEQREDAVDVCVIEVPGRLVRE